MMAAEAAAGTRAHHGQPAFLEWSAAGFGAELVRVSPPDDPGQSPGKRALGKGWETIEVTPSILQTWARGRYNVGLRTRRHPAVDVDVDDPEIADACERVILATLGSSARRVRGNSPRRVLLYALQGEPFAKKAIKFILPDGSEGQVEILANGQQVVVAGTHHTGAAIEWPAGQPSAAALPTITVEQRDALLSALRTRLVEMGCQVEGAAGAESRPSLPTPARSFTEDPARDEQIARAALDRLDPDMEHDDWARAGMALHSKWPDTGGAGFTLWDVWSSWGTKYPGQADLERKWRSFKPGGGITLATLLHMAGLDGAGRPAGSVSSPFADGGAPQHQEEAAPDGAEPSPFSDDRNGVTGAEARADRPKAPQGATEVPAGDVVEVDETSPSLAQLNEEVFVIEEAGKHFVACEWFDPMRHRLALKRFTFQEFKNRHLGRRINIGQRFIPLAKAWLEWGHRRQYLGGVIFDPTGKAPKDVFNLWRGWPIPPRQGDWTILREHIRDVLCGGAGDLDTYVIGWLRSLVQHPDQPGEVVLVFRGLQGAGKTILGNAVRRMCGQHALAVSSPRAVVGQFNAHLRDLVFLLANEAVFAGDRASTSVLKSLITDETLFIEQKGIDVVEVPNFLHIMMTTNADWAVPVARDDRRFAVFDVSPRRVGNRSYFRDVYAAVNSDAVIAAMLFDLLNSPLDGFEVRDIPETSARHEQMVHSLEGEQAWLFHVLGLGTLGAGATAWSTWASTRVLQESHELWARNGRYRNATDPATLGKYLARFFKALRPRRDNPERERGYWLGSLDEARSRFCEVSGLPTTVFPDDSMDQPEEAP